MRLVYYKVANYHVLKETTYTEHNMRIGGSGPATAHLLATLARKIVSAYDDCTDEGNVIICNVMELKEK